MSTRMIGGWVNNTFMPFMGESEKALAKAIPNAQHRTMEGQREDVNAEVLAPV